MPLQMIQKLLLLQCFEFEILTGPNLMPRVSAVQKASKQSAPRKVRSVRKPQRIHRSIQTTKHEQAIERFSELIIRAIQAKFSRSTFTRDDILGLVSQMRLDSTDAWASGTYGVNDVATGTRYRKVCDAVQRLIAKQQLTALDWLRLCLPNMHAKLSEETPPQLLYLPTVRKLIKQNFKSGVTLDAMAVVRLWRSDQHVPENVKRMAVRGVFPLLARERLLKRGEYNQFMVREV
jgi:hypothetical protein